MSERAHLDWLLNKTAATAQEVITLWGQAKALPEESDERATVEGLLLAWLYQLELDAKDARAEHDAWLEALPDEGQVSL